MISKCVLMLFISTLCYGKDSFSVKTLYLGNVYEYKECNYSGREGVLSLTQILNNNISLQFVILRAMTSNVPVIKLKLRTLYEFDNSSMLVCEVEDKKLNNEKFSTKIIVKDRKFWWDRKTVVSKYTYKEGNRVFFNCSTNGNTLYNSLHWIKVNDEYTPQSIIASDYNNYNNDKILAYQTNLTKEDNGNKLICIYFQCEIYGKKAVCERIVLKEISLILSSNENNFEEYVTGESQSGLILGGASIIAGILIVVVAMIWYWKRNCKVEDNMESTIQYIEVEFGDTPSIKSRAPLNDNEVIYSKVTGVIVPGLNK